MYRYTYNTESAKWEIQLLIWGLYWKTVRGLSFDSLAMAKQGVAQRGISEHFREQQPFNYKPGVPIHDTPVTAEQENLQ